MSETNSGAEIDFKAFTAVVTIVSSAAYAFTVGYLDEHNIYTFPGVVEATKFFTWSIFLTRWNAMIASAFVGWILYLEFAKSRTVARRWGVIGTAAALIVGASWVFENQFISKFVVAVGALFFSFVPAVAILAYLYSKNRNPAEDIPIVAASWIFSLLLLCGIGHKAASDAFYYPVQGSQLVVWSGEVGQYLIECSNELQPSLFWRKDVSENVTRVMYVDVIARNNVCLRHF